MQQSKQSKTLPAISPKQQTILRLLYRYRFLDRTHIQHLLNHKDHKTIQTWLNNLTTKQFIIQNYSRTFPNNTKPAIYYLAPNGITWLATQPEFDKRLLHKLYREKERSTGFITHSLLLATLDLKLRNQPSGSVQTTMTVKSDFPGLQQADLLTRLSPHALVNKTEAGATKCYLLELLTDLPEPRLKQRIKAYIAFYLSNEWESATGNGFPTVLFVCQDLPMMITLKRFTKKLLVTKEATALNILMTTLEEVTKEGLTGEIWEGVA